MTKIETIVPRHDWAALPMRTAMATFWPPTEDRLRFMKQLGIDARFMGGDGICTVKMAELAGEAVGEGKVVCAVAGGVTEDKVAALEDFKKRFKQKFGIEVQLYAPYSYDAATALIETAVQQLRLGGRPEPFPGAPELG